SLLLVLGPVGVFHSRERPCSDRSRLGSHEAEAYAWQGATERQTAGKSTRRDADTNTKTEEGGEEPPARASAAPPLQKRKCVVGRPRQRRDVEGSQLGYVDSLVVDVISPLAIRFASTSRPFNTSVFSQHKPTTAGARSPQSIYKGGGFGTPQSDCGIGQGFG